MNYEFIIQNIKDLDNKAGYLASILELYQHEINCVAFYGEMGVGKTTLIKALCKSFKVIDTVNSPTFAIINEYSVTTSRKIYHFDFYRINKQEEVFDLGYEDYFYSKNLCLIEWPEKIENLLPQNIISVHLQLLSDNSRHVKVNIKT